jgi:hypothetical protein
MFYDDYVRICEDFAQNFSNKLKGRHFDTIEVIEADLHTVLNTLTVHDFQDALKNGRSVRR